MPLRRQSVCSPTLSLTVCQPARDCYDRCNGVVSSTLPDLFDCWRRARQKITKVHESHVYVAVGRLTRRNVPGWRKRYEY